MAQGDVLEAMVKVKICGVTRPEDARAAVAAGADAIGINFAPESKRYIGSIERAADLIKKTDKAHAISWAGVFVNSPGADIERAVRELSLAIVQLHGDETPQDVAALRLTLPHGTMIWKVFRISGENDLAAVTQYKCDGWLLDARYEGARGGEGKSFDWNVLKGLARTTPIVLAGGLTPENVSQAVAQVRPDWVDVASGVESAPGVKAADKIERFVRGARA
jgi:phosphoribosylanthranilate isomerase